MYYYIIYLRLGYIQRNAYTHTSTHPYTYQLRSDTAQNLYIFIKFITFSCSLFDLIFISIQLYIMWCKMLNTHTPHTYIIKKTAAFITLCHHHTHTHILLQIYFMVRIKKKKVPIEQKKKKNISGGAVTQLNDLCSTRETSLCFCCCFLIILSYVYEPYFICMHIFINKTCLRDNKILNLCVRACSWQTLYKKKIRETTRGMCVEWCTVSSSACVFGQCIFFSSVLWTPSIVIYLLPNLEHT